MKKRLNFPFLFMLLAIAITVPIGCHNNKQTYSIAIEMQHKLAGKVIFLQKYQGKSLVTIDSIPTNYGGKVVFKGNRLLESGMYAISISPKIHVNFFISNQKNQQFSINLNVQNPIHTLTFKGSIENQAFINYLRFLEIKQKQQPSRQLQLEISQKCDELEQKFLGTMLALYIHSLRVPNIPEPNIPFLITNRKQVLRKYYYNFMVNHFFDSINFSDSRLLKMPVLEQKMGLYFRQIVNPQPDSVIFRIDEVLAKAKINNEVYKWTIRYLYNLFLNSPVPGHWKVSYHLGKDYILKESGRWNDSGFVEQVRRKVKKDRLNSVGLMATNLKLQTSEGKNVELYSIRSPLTVLYFFNPSCDACKRVTKELYKIYQNYQKERIQVFAVNVGINKEEWLHYITINCSDWINVYEPDGSGRIMQKYDINAIPMIYLLDKNKVIIAKDIPVEKIKNFVGNSVVRVH